MKRKHAVHHFTHSLATPVSRYVLWKGGDAVAPHCWLEPGNWQGGMVPGEGDIVVIPDCGNAEILPPVIDCRVPDIGQLRIEKGGHLAILPTGKLCVDGLNRDYGGVVNHGTLVLGGELHILHPWDAALLNSGIFINKGTLVLDRWAWDAVHHIGLGRYIERGQVEELVF